MDATCTHVDLTAGCEPCEKEARDTGRWDVIAAQLELEREPDTRPCKSPTHRHYSEALETMDVSAGLIARELETARGTLGPRGSRDVAVLKAMEDAAEKIAWAQRQLDNATAAVNAHFDRGCRNLQALDAAAGR